MADATVKVVSCTFFNPKTKLIEEANVHVASGLGPLMLGCRNACERMARFRSAPYFAMPSFVEKGGNERWLVFKMTSGAGTLQGSAVLLRDWPTRAAADMWVQHNG